MENIKISIIIPNYNGQKLLSACLDSIAQQTFKDYEVILVDNHSQDESLSLAKKYARVKPICLDRNYGFARAVNIGIKQALANPAVEFVACVNNDVTLDKDWLKQMLQAMQVNRQVGICAARIYFAHLPQTINSTGDLYFRNGLANYRGVWQKDAGQFEREEFVFGATGAACLYRRKMLDEIGLFDEDFFLYYEDMDLSFRAQLMGYRCLYVPEARVWHIHGATYGHRADYYNARNCIFTLIKNMPRSLLLKYSFSILAGQLGLLYRKRRNLSAIIKGQIDALRQLNLMLDKRRAIQKNKTVTDNYIASILQKK